MVVVQMGSFKLGRLFKKILYNGIKVKKSPGDLNNLNNTEFRCNIFTTGICFEGDSCACSDSLLLSGAGTLNDPVHAVSLYQWAL